MKLFPRLCMLLVILPSLMLPLATEAEENTVVPIPANVETVTRPSLFVRCIRPPLRTIKTMTGVLSYILGSITILGCINVFTGSVVEKDLNVLSFITSVWLANKAIYHMSDYTLEEMN